MGKGKGNVTHGFLTFLLTMFSDAACFHTPVDGEVGKVLLVAAKEDDSMLSADVWGKGWEVWVPCF